MIIRRKLTGRFTQVPNAIHDDGRLSLEAKGLLGYLLSRPRNWEVRHDVLRRKFNLTRDRLGRLLRELIGAGYLERDGDQPRDELNRFAAYDYVVRDESATNRADASLPVSEFRCRKSGIENKREVRNTDNKDSPLSPQSAPVALPQAIRDQYTQFGRNALAAGMLPVFEHSKAFEAWKVFRGDDGMPPIDRAVIDGRHKSVVWLPSIYPPRGRSSHAPIKHQVRNEGDDHEPR